jgi:hypothetical protein
VAPKTPKHRPFTLRQQRENALFLAALRQTGNVRLACRQLQLHRGTYEKRRRANAAFATRWDAALAAAHAAFQLAGGARLPEPGAGGRVRRKSAPLRTEGGEPHIVRRANGRLQLRLAPPGRMTAAAERLYLAALAASANVRLAAAAAGFAHSSFYARRARWTGFGARMRQALRIGYDRLEYVVMERTLEALHGAETPDWLAEAIAATNPLPPLSFDQAFQQLCLHRNSVRLDAMRPPGRPARVERTPTQAMAAIARNLDAIQRAGRYQVTGTWTLPGEVEVEAPTLVPLELVTGWSTADPERRKHNPDRALFGGWRIDDHKKRKKVVKG